MSLVEHEIYNLVLAQRPKDIHKIPKLLEIAYGEGMDDRSVLIEMRKKLNVVIVEIDVKQVEAEVIQIYTNYNPDKLPSVSRLMEKYRGFEQQVRAWV